MRDWTITFKKTNKGSNMNLKIDTGADISVIGKYHLAQMVSL